jgi:3-hydroxybutyryl-CoA dehydrogenase
MEVENVKRVAIIGSGLMGSGIGLEFARFGFEVNLYDINNNALRRALEAAKEDLSLMRSLGLISAEGVKAARERLHPTADFHEAASTADYIVEAVPDRLSLKQEIFQKLDAICPPSVILATNTSRLSIDEIASLAKSPERILITHYFSPPHFIPLVEIYGGEKGSFSAIDRAAKLLRFLKKKVFIVSSANVAGKNKNLLPCSRLQSGLNNAIYALWEEGMAHTEIDDIVTYGFGRRLPFMGFFKRTDWVGFESRMERMTKSGKMFEVMSAMMNRGELGIKSGKGFYNWPGNTGKEMEIKLKTELGHMLKNDIDEGLL